MLGSSDNFIFLFACIRIDSIKLTVINPPVVLGPGIGEPTQTGSLTLFKKLITNSKLAKISIIGLGMRTHTGVANKMFTAIASKNINIHVISTSEIKISVLIDEKLTNKALKILHSSFNLDKN